MPNQTLLVSPKSEEKSPQPRPGFQRQGENNTEVCGRFRIPVVQGEEPRVFLLDDESVAMRL